MYAKFTIQKIEILSGVLYTSAILAFGDGIFWCHIICCQQFQKRSNEVDLALKIFWYYINLHGPVSAILGFCSFSATFVQHTSILKSIISLQPPPPQTTIFQYLWLYPDEFQVIWIKFYMASLCRSSMIHDLRGSNPF